jgi:hypothetical protein
MTPAYNTRQATVQRQGGTAQHIPEVGFRQVV